jgi:uncharacterized membrane protein YdfJ with MMPL/SSD domain
MNGVYLIIVWVVCLAYIALNLYFKDFFGRVLAAIIFFAAAVVTMMILST